MARARRPRLNRGTRPAADARVRRKRRGCYNSESLLGTLLATCPVVRPVPGAPQPPAAPAACTSHAHDQHRRTQLAVLGEHLAHQFRGRPGLHPRAQVQPRRRPHLPERRAGAGAPAADAAPARPGRGPQHRRLHLRLPRLAAGRLRPGAVARAQAPGSRGREVHSGPQRRPRRDHGLGHAADQPVPGRQGRWRLRHVVRQGPGRGPLRRRVQARQRRRHRQVRRRARARGRRPQLPQLHPAARLRARIRQRDDAGAQPGRRAGHPRHGPDRLGDVALHRPLGRLQDDRRNRGVLRLGRRQSARARHRHPDRFRDARRRPQHPLAGSAAQPGNAPAPVRGQGRAGVRARQPHRPHGHRFAQRAPGHHHHRQVLPRRAAGAGIPRPRRARLRRPGHPRLQGRHDLAAGTGRPAQLRARPAGHRGGRREARLHRKPDEGVDVQLGRWRPPVDRRQVRRERRVDPAVSTGELTPARIAGVIARRIQRFHNTEHIEERAALDGGEGIRTRPAARAVPARAALLLGLPAQHLDRGAGRLARAGRHRLPLHGHLDGPQHRHLHPHGRRRRDVGGPGGVHRNAARVPEPRRRHLLPLAVRWRSASRSPPASTSPTRSSTTTRSR